MQPRCTPEANQQSREDVFVLEATSLEDVAIVLQLVDAFLALQQELRQARQRGDVLALVRLNVANDQLMQQLAGFRVDANATNNASREHNLSSASSGSSSDIELSSRRSRSSASASLHTFFGLSSSSDSSSRSSEGYAASCDSDSDHTPAAPPPSPAFGRRSQ